MENSLCNNLESCWIAQAQQVIFWQVFMSSSENPSYRIWRFLHKSCRAKIVSSHRKTWFLRKTKHVCKFKANNTSLDKFSGFYWNPVLPVYFVRIVHFPMENSLWDNKEICSGTQAGQVASRQVCILFTENRSYRIWRFVHKFCNGKNIFVTQRNSCLHIHAVKLKNIPEKEEDKLKNATQGKAVFGSALSGMSIQPIE